MPLRQIPLIKQPTLQLSASPYIPGGSGRFRYKSVEVKPFVAWVCKHFEPGAIYGEFELAKAMGVHRVIANEWLGGLVAQGYLESENVIKAPTDLQCLGFSVPDNVYQEHCATAVQLGFDKLKDYDPWTDRSLDGIVEDAQNPHNYVDKFYSPYHHEYYLIIGKQRIRPNQTYFVPTSIDVIEGLVATHSEWEPKLRAAIDRVVSGDKTMQRPTP